MSRYIGSVCKLCLREGEKLFLKGQRCYNKCTLDRRKISGPGQHGASRHGKSSEYARRLREKQKAKRIAGLNEAQFRRIFRQAERMSGQTGLNLLRLLEMRLDTVVYLAGFASSRAQARQLVSHRHIKVNGRIINFPSRLLQVGDKIELKPQSQSNEIFKKYLEDNKSRVPSWLSLQPENFSAEVIRYPERDEMSYRNISEQLIVELYSK